MFQLKINNGSLYETDKGLDTVNFRGNNFTATPTTKKIIDPHIDLIKNIVNNQLIKKLREKGFTVNERNYSAYNETRDAVKNPYYDDVLEIYKGFKFRIYYITETIYFVCDPSLTIRPKASIKYLVDNGVNAKKLVGSSILDLETLKKIGYLVSLPANGTPVCKIQPFDESTREIEMTAITFEPRSEIIQGILSSMGRTIDFEKTKRTLTFLSSTTSSKDRLTETLSIIKNLSEQIFPLEFGDFIVNIDEDPAVVKI